MATNYAAIKTLNLKKIVLYYDNNTAIEVPEDSTSRVGSAFFKVIQKEQLDWKVFKLRPPLIERVKQLFRI